MGDMDCDKCGSWLHHPWKCKRYEMYSLNVCKVCGKGLHHVEKECMGNFRDKWESYKVKKCEKLGISIRCLEIYSGNADSVSKYESGYVGTCRKDFDRKLSDKRCEKCGDRHFPWNCQKYLYSVQDPCTNCNKNLFHKSSVCEETVIIKYDRKRKRYEGYHSPDRCKPVFSSTHIRSTACQTNSTDTSSTDTRYNTSSTPDLTSSTSDLMSSTNNSSTLGNKGYLNQSSVIQSKFRSLKDDVQLMAIYGDEDLKHFLKEPVSRDFYVQNETFKCDKNLLKVDVHESYTLNKIVNEIVHPFTESERDIFIGNSIVQLKEQDKKEAKGMNLRRIISSTQLYVKTCLQYKSQLSERDTFENIVCKLDVKYEGNLINLALVNRLNISLEPYDHSVHSFRGEHNHNIKGTVSLELYFKTNKDKLIQICLKFYAMELESDVEAIFGSNFLLNNKEIISLNPDCLTWEIVAAKCSSDGDCATLKRDTVQNFSFHFKGDLSHETLPGNDVFFREYQELAQLDANKKYSIYDGDYSFCPENYRDSLTRLLKDFEDRFMTSDLDFEVINHYEAELDTLHDKKLCEKAKRIPEKRFEQAHAAVKQFESVGILSTSDSKWRSNIVLIPRDEEKSSRFRVGLDFKELNNILVCPEDVKFAPLDEMLGKLKGKVVVRLDLSAIQSMIPIKPEDRYKTSFWLNK